MALKSTELYKFLHEEIAGTMLRLGFKKSKPNLSYSQPHPSGFFKIEFTSARMAVNVVNEGSNFQTQLGITNSVDEKIWDLRKAVRLSDAMTFEERLEIQLLNAQVCDKRLDYWKKWAMTQPEPIRSGYQTWDPPWSRNNSPPEIMAKNQNLNYIEYLDKSDVEAIGRLLSAQLPRALDIGKASIEAKVGTLSP